MQFFEYSQVEGKRLEREFLVDRMILPNHYQERRYRHFQMDWTHFAISLRPRKTHHRMKFGLVESCQMMSGISTEHLGSLHRPAPRGVPKGFKKKTAGGIQRSC